MESSNFIEILGKLVSNPFSTGNSSLIELTQLHCLRWKMYEENAYKIVVACSQICRNLWYFCILLEKNWREKKTMTKCQSRLWRADETNEWPQITKRLKTKGWPGWSSAQLNICSNDYNAIFKRKKNDLLLQKMCDKQLCQITTTTSEQVGKGIANHYWPQIVYWLWLSLPLSPVTGVLWLVFLCSQLSNPIRGCVSGSVGRPYWLLAFCLLYAFRSVLTSSMKCVESVSRVLIKTSNQMKRHRDYI